MQLIHCITEKGKRSVKFAFQNGNAYIQVVLSVSYLAPMLSLERNTMCVKTSKTVKSIVKEELQFALVFEKQKGRMLDACWTCASKLYAGKYCILCKHIVPCLTNAPLAVLRSSNTKLLLNEQPSRSKEESKNKNNKS